MAGFSPAYLSTEIKVINNAEMSEYNFAVIFIWPLLATAHLLQMSIAFQS